jgi:dihydrolipoamide dehydrogenase
LSGRAEIVRIVLSDGGLVEAEELLVATGRRPRIHDLGLDTVGLETRGAIEVDETFRAPGKGWLYAIGDVNGLAPLTHMGKYQAHVVHRRSSDVPPTPSPLL